MITVPKIEQFLVDPEMEIEPFDPKLIKETIPNYPYKFLLKILNEYYPDCKRWENEDINDLYFSMLDDYNRYGVSFDRNLNLFPDNNLYVNENDNGEKPKYELLYNYDKKTSLFNKVKKINLNEYDTGEKPLSEKEKSKRYLIKKVKNKFLQVAIMDPDVYNNNKLFMTLIFESDPFNEFLSKSSLINIDGIIENFFKITFKKEIDLIKNLIHRIDEENEDISD